MRRLVTALAAGTLALGLLGLGPASASADDCDPDHPFTALPLDSADLVVDVAGTQPLRFTIDGPEGCWSGDAYVRLTTPHQEQIVQLSEDGDWVPGRRILSGVYVVDPVLLRNPDAGTWRATYEVEGEVYAQTTLQVRRATRLSFDAGPLRHRKATFRGRLERADWEWRAYRTYGRKKVVVSRLGATDAEAATTVARTKTTKRGKYHVRTRVPGAGGYQAAYAGNTTSAPSTSQVDLVRSAR